MGLPVSALLAGWCLASAGGAGYACEAPGLIDPPINIASDCSFSAAAETDIDFFEGGEAIDIGGGRVAQKLDEVGCMMPSDESLLVVDCNTRETVRIRGVQEREDWPEHLVRLLQPPFGRIALTRATSVGDLIAVSEREGYAYRTDVIASIRRMSPRNRFDPYCGCKLFYPDSAGARLKIMITEADTGTSR